MRFLVCKCRCLIITLSLFLNDCRVKQRERLANERSQIAAATRMASSLKEAVLYQSHAASVRNEKFFTDILPPKQTILYQEWLLKNRDRCQRAIIQRKNSIASAAPDSAESVCLLDICRKLEETLMISKGEND